MNFKYTLYISDPANHPEFTQFFDLLDVPYGTIDPSKTNCGNYPIMVVSNASNDEAGLLEPCIALHYHDLNEWGKQNITLYTLSDTCPVCEIIKERLTALNISFAERPAALCKNHVHFPVMEVCGREKAFGAKDLMKLVNTLESVYGKDGVRS